MTKMQIRQIFCHLAFFAATLSQPAHAALTTVFSDNFDNGVPSQISGTYTLSSTEGYSGKGNPGNTFSGNYLRNTSGGSYPYWGTPGQPTTLTLTGLPAHDSVSIGFLLAIIDSWDGSYDAQNPGLFFANWDYFNVSIDGTTIFSETFSHRFLPQYVQSYVAPAGGAIVTPASNSLLAGSAYADSAYDMYLESIFQNISHTADTLTISFWANGAGWQGSTDESWAIDNLQVQVNTLPEPEPQPVPTPPTLWCVFAGIAGLVLTQRIRKREFE